jgi:hypothetical protein
MYRKWIALGILVPVVVTSLLIASPLLLSVFAPRSKPGPTGVSLSSYMEGKQSDILAMAILGNSSDIVYPDLMEALFVALGTGAWNMTASFVNDTDVQHITFWETAFEASIVEVGSINDAIYTGLASTTQSSDSLLSLQSAPIGFGIDVLYKDGTWIQLFTLQDAKGHIVFVNGTYTGIPDPTNPFNGIVRDLNWLSGYLFEPVTALDGLVTAIHAVFENHLSP